MVGILHLVSVVDVDGGAGSHLDLESESESSNAGPATTTTRGFPRSNAGSLIRHSVSQTLSSLPLSTCNTFGLGRPKVSSQMFFMDCSRVFFGRWREILFTVMSIRDGWTSESVDDNEIGPS